MADRVVFFAGAAEDVKGPYYGTLAVQPDSLELTGDGEIRLPMAAIRSVSLLKRNGQPMSIRVNTTDGNVVSFGAVRFRIGRLYVMTDFVRTGALFKELRAWAGVEVPTPEGPLAEGPEAASPEPK